ncbi:MAG TPA: hypothetical protein DCF63_15870 [Planctomycetaceae bacterium]|nr:hypothetical protein [Planctomycetaceae bacterium]
MLTSHDGNCRQEARRSVSRWPKVLRSFSAGEPSALSSDAAVVPNGKSERPIAGSGVHAGGMNSGGPPEFGLAVGSFHLGGTGGLADPLDCDTKMPYQNKNSYH